MEPEKAEAGVGKQLRRRDVRFSTELAPVLWRNNNDTTLKKRLAMHGSTFTFFATTYHNQTMIV